MIIKSFSFPTETPPKNNTFLVGSKPMEKKKQKTIKAHSSSVFPSFVFNVCFFAADGTDNKRKAETDHPVSKCATERNRKPLTMMLVNLKQKAVTLE